MIRYGRQSRGVPRCYGFRLLPASDPPPVNLGASWDLQTYPVILRDVGQEASGDMLLRDADWVGFGAPAGPFIVDPDATRPNALWDCCWADAPGDFIAPARGATELLFQEILGDSQWTGCPGMDVRRFQQITLAFHNGNAGNVAATCYLGLLTLVINVPSGNSWWSFGQNAKEYPMVLPTTFSVNYRAAIGGMNLQIFGA